MPRAGKDGRVLSKRISTSTTIADLGDPKTIMLATWIIPHCDDQGRLEANPRKIKALVCPMLDWLEVEDVERALDRMDELDYILLYKAPDGTLLLQLLSWWRWNSGQTWIYPSEWPAPPGWTDRLRYRSGGKQIEQQHSYQPSDVVPHCSTLSHNVERSETVVDVVALPSPTPTTTPSPSPGEGVQGEGGADLSDPDDDGLQQYGYTRTGEQYVAADHRCLTQAYHENLGLPSQIVIEQLEEALITYGADWCIDALTEAVRNEKRNWAYCEAILKRWKRDGRGPRPQRDSGPDPPWAQIGLTREEFLKQYGEVAEFEVNRWESGHTKKPP